MEIKELITDVDGVLTTGRYFYSEIGKLLKEFGPHDSDGFKIVRSLGISVRAISADHRGFEITKKRLDDMGVELHLVSELDRLDWVKKNCNPEQTVFVGDGLHDIAPMKLCAMSFAPCNALPITKANASYVTQTSGGNGVMFEVAMEILKTVNMIRYQKIIVGDVDE